MSEVAFSGQIFNVALSQDCKMSKDIGSRN